MNIHDFDALGRLSLTVLNKPTVGKTFVSDECAVYGPEGSLTSVIKQKKVKAVAETSDDKDDSEREALSKLTTFNLGISGEEKNARQKVVLPFWRDEQKKSQPDTVDEEESVRILPKSSSCGHSGGRIDYTPEEEDDWDDEDPDDDLDV